MILLNDKSVIALKDEWFNPQLCYAQASLDKLLNTLIGLDILICYDFISCKSLWIKASDKSQTVVISTGFQHKNTWSCPIKYDQRLRW